MMLDDDLQPPAWVTHLVLRGTYLPDTMRCTAGDRFRPPSYLSDEFDYDVNPRVIKCYIDMRANAYVLGSGPSTLTVYIARDIYWDGGYAGMAADEGTIEQDVIEEIRHQFEADIGDALAGREHVLFLGPPPDLSSETWQAIGYWDVQRQEDGVVIAVHPRRELWRHLRPDDYQTHRSALEMELPAFTQAVTTAHQARMEEYGGRIGADATLPMLVSDANQLRQYYTEVGAYDDPDNPPAQPPVARTCTNGTAVPDQGANPDLMQDCIALLAARDALRGAATLNWSTDTPITGWQGVLVQGKPARVQELTLANLGLSGTIPPELGRLDDLRRLELDGNKLTGPIPSELGDLAHLHLLYLFDNQLTGALPASLGRLHRLEALFAQGNRLSGTIPPELGGMVSLQQLLLSDNRLTRPIPSGLSGLRGLSELWLSGNALTGAIPSWLSELSALTILSLRDNKLTGGIPAGLGGLSDLQDLYLSGNSLTGCIPPALRSVPHHDLAGLRLPDCAA